MATANKQYKPKQVANRFAVGKKFAILELPDDEIAYPMNWDEVYNLKGRLLTLIDATFTDPQQRKAFKDVSWQLLQTWFDDHVAVCENRPFYTGT